MSLQIMNTLIVYKSTFFYCICKKKIGLGDIWRLNNTFKNKIKIYKKGKCNISSCVPVENITASRPLLTSIFKYTFDFRQIILFVISLGMHWNKLLTQGPCTPINTNVLKISSRFIWQMAIMHKPFLIFLFYYYTKYPTIYFFSLIKIQSRTHPFCNLSQFYIIIPWFMSDFDLVSSGKQWRVWLST